MDPLEILCQVKNSFNNDRIPAKFQKYSENFVGSPRTRRAEMITDKKLEIKNLQIGKVLERDIPNRIFQHYSSYILANIDTIYNFSKQTGGYLIPQVISENYKYAVLGSDVGFIEYLQFRLPESTGFISKCIKLQNEYKINKNCDDKFVNYMMDISPGGVDLVVANNSDYRSNLIQALQICKPKGVFVSKINNIDYETLYITTLCFREFSLLRPFLSGEVFVVAENYIGNSLDIVPILIQNRGIKVPESFLQYVDSAISSSISETEYNLYRCKALMNVP